MVRTGRPKKPKDEVKELVAVRLEPNLIATVDGYVAWLKSEYPLFEPTRADAIRQLLHAGIKAEKRKGKSF